MFEPFVHLLQYLLLLKFQQAFFLKPFFANVVQVPTVVDCSVSQLSCSDM